MSYKSIVSHNIRIYFIKNKHKFKFLYIHFGKDNQTIVNYSHFVMYMKDIKVMCKHVKILYLMKDSTINTLNYLFSMLEKDFLFGK